MRHEDLDAQRSRHEYAVQIEDDLRWLGLDWDEGGLENRKSADSLLSAKALPYSQSKREDIYREMLSSLCRSGMVYPCYCTRADIMATQAPHQSDGRIVYSGKCRPVDLPDYNFSMRNLEGLKDERQWRSLRLTVPNTDICFEDIICGAQCFNLANDCGDMILHRADGAWAYQLAVVADDHFMGITEVMRGNDLLLSTAQQLYLYRLMGWEAPQYLHLPLLVNNEGQRLSKRDGSLNMEALRKQLYPEELIGRLAKLSGITNTDNPVSPKELIEKFSSDKLKNTNTLTIDNNFSS